MYDRSHFRDQTVLARWCRGLLFAQAAMALVSIASSFVTLKFLAGLIADTANATGADADDARTGLIALVTLLLYAANVATIGTWIFRASRNAWILRPDDMEIKPGWAVGWYFVPFANLYLPFQAMKEIWMVSADVVSAGHRRDADGLLNGWWGCWLLSNILASIAFQIQLRSESVEGLRLSVEITIASDLISIPACLLLAWIIKQITEMQGVAPPVETAT